MKKPTNKEIKEIVFEHFCEVEHFEINKGHTKAALDDLIDFYKSAYRHGYIDAVNKINQVCSDEYMAAMYKNEETK